MTYPPTCRRRLAAHTLTLYLAGELSPRAAQAVQEHLVACPLCARACEDQRLAQRLLRTLTMERPVPAEVDARIQRSLRAGAGAQLGAGSLRFLRSTRAASKRGRIERAQSEQAPPRGAFPGVAIVLGAAMLLAIGLEGIGGLPSLSLPLSGSDSSVSHATVTVSSGRKGPSSTGNDAGAFFAGGGGGRQQLR